MNEEDGGDEEEEEHEKEEKDGEEKVETKKNLLIFLSIYPISLNQFVVFMLFSCKVTKIRIMDNIDKSRDVYHYLWHKTTFHIATKHENEDCLLLAVEKWYSRNSYAKKI